MLVCGMWNVVCGYLECGMWYVGMWYVICGYVECDMLYVVCGMW
jgi:hypothetical protein